MRLAAACASPRTAKAWFESSATGTSEIFLFRFREQGIQVLAQSLDVSLIQVRQEGLNASDDRACGTRRGRTYTFLGVQSNGSGGDFCGSRTSRGRYADL